jgi:hypothetical protein
MYREKDAPRSLTGLPVVQVLCAWTIRNGDNTCHRHLGARGLKAVCIAETPQIAESPQRGDDDAAAAAAAAAK